MLRGEETMIQRKDKGAREKKARNGTTIKSKIFLDGEEEMVKCDKKQSTLNRDKLEMRENKLGGGAKRSYHDEPTDFSFSHSKLYNSRVTFLMELVQQPNEGEPFILGCCGNMQNHFITHTDMKQLFYADW